VILSSCGEFVHFLERAPNPQPPRRSGHRPAVKKLAVQAQPMTIQRPSRGMEFFNSLRDTLTTALADQEKLTEPDAVIRTAEQGLDNFWGGIWLYIPDRGAEPATAQRADFTGTTMATTSPSSAGKPHIRCSGPQDNQGATRHATGHHQTKTGAPARRTSPAIAGFLTTPPPAEWVPNTKISATHFPS